MLQLSTGPSHFASPVALSLSYASATECAFEHKRWPKLHTNPSSLYSFNLSVTVTFFGSASHRPLPHFLPMGGLDLMTRFLASFEGFGARRCCKRLSASGLALLELDSVDMLESVAQPLESEELLLHAISQKCHGYTRFKGSKG